MATRAGTETRELSASISQQELAEALEGLSAGAKLLVVARHGGRVRVEAGEVFRVAVVVEELNDDELGRVDTIMSAAGNKAGADYDKQDAIHLRVLDELILTLQAPAEDVARIVLEIARKGLGPTLTVVAKPPQQAKVIPLFPGATKDE